MIVSMLSKSLRNKDSVDIRNWHSFLSHLYKIVHFKIIMIKMEFKKKFLPIRKVDSMESRYYPITKKALYDFGL